MRLFRHNGLTPLLVFDGDRLPAKAAEEEERRARRAEKRAGALALLAAGQKSAAEAAFQTCIDVTPAMAREVMDGLEQESFAFLVAPYEADAQLAYLARSGAVDLIATEDSDLVAYGCPHVLFKLDKQGACEELVWDSLFAKAPRVAAPKAADGDDGDEMGLLEEAGGAKPGGRALSFARMMPDTFLLMCILAGCDFLDSLPNVGIKRAHALARRTGSVERFITWLRVEAGHVGEAHKAAYAAGLKRAWHTFRHARVYDPQAKQLVHLSPLPEELAAAELDFLGPAMTAEHVIGIADGVLCPFSRQPFPPRQAAVPGSRAAGHVGPMGASLRHAAPQLQSWPPPPPPVQHQQHTHYRAPGRHMLQNAQSGRMPAPRAGPPKVVDANISGLQSLLSPWGKVATPFAIGEASTLAADTAVTQQEQVQPPPGASQPQASQPAQRSNPFARAPGAPTQRPVFAGTDLFGAAPGVVDSSAGAMPASTQASRAAPQGQATGAGFGASLIGRMFTGALTAGAAWLESPSKSAAPPAGRPSAGAMLLAIKTPPPVPAAGGPGGIRRFLSPMSGDDRPGVKKKRRSGL